MTTQDSIFLPASRFADKGDWTLEQQFILQMGSSYLLAHGLGTPLAADAETTCTVPEEGDYTLLVRTKNWIRPWSDGPAPGIFQVKIDGTADGETFGTGADDRWYWQKGGKHHLTAGEHRIALHDDVDHAGLEQKIRAGLRDDRIILALDGLEAECAAAGHGARLAQTVAEPRSEPAREVAHAVSPLHEQRNARGGAHAAEAGEALGKKHAGAGRARRNGGCDAGGSAPAHHDIGIYPDGQRAGVRNSRGALPR